MLKFAYVKFVIFEFTDILIEALEKLIVLFIVYRPPSFSVKDCIDEFAFLLLSLHKFSVNADLSVAGDFIINLLKNKSHDFTNLLLSLNKYPTFFHATHITKTSRSLLDNFFTNCNQPWESGVLGCDLSDHEMVFLCTNRRAAHP